MTVPDNTSPAAGSVPEAVPAVGETAPAFEALCCDGETFVARTLSETLGDAGAVLAFYGFTHSAVAENWWKIYDRRGWDDFPVPVVGVARDGPFAQNDFLRGVDSPFRSFSDGSGEVCAAYGLLHEPRGMPGAEIPHRTVFVLDGEGTIVGRWVLTDRANPVPASDVEECVAALDGGN